MKENNENKVSKSMRIEKEISDKIDEILRGKRYTFTDIINIALFSFLKTNLMIKLCLIRLKRMLI